LPQTAPCPFPWDALISLPFWNPGRSIKNWNTQKPSLEAVNSLLSGVSASLSRPMYRHFTYGYFKAISPGYWMSFFYKRSQIKFPMCYPRYSLRKMYIIYTLGMHFLSSWNSSQAIKATAFGVTTNSNSILKSFE
jgi:hypothetical protein